MPVIYPLSALHVAKIPFYFSFLSGNKIFIYMNDFTLFFLEGIRHITDLKGYDHILFIMALCLPYVVQDWKKILWLVTAFTIGHSVTLALSTYNKILVSSKWIEWLIPITIMITAIQNVIIKKQEGKNWIRYITALIFGLIHGMGFSNYLRSMIGKDESIVTQLLAFNIGLEAGQIVIVLLVMFVGFIFARLVKVPRREWLLFVSGGIFAAALQMMIERSAAL
ncbi:MAG: HupE/UreJ family protein [Agriterribacter sp.]